mmetsp:Transcript_2703/g.6108  ORF Transcript_2703/g.6108 Transcript_2703/m.6108 type:complete len:282 (-) Transcript_2703:197-1042(-)
MRGHHTQNVTRRAARPTQVLHTAMKRQMRAPIPQPLHTHMIWYGRLKDVEMRAPCKESANRLSARCTLTHRTARRGSAAAASRAPLGISPSRRGQWSHDPPGMCRRGRTFGNVGPSFQPREHSGADRPRKASAWSRSAIAIWSSGPAGGKGARIEHCPKPQCTPHRSSRRIACQARLERHPNRGTAPYAARTPPRARGRRPFPDRTPRTPCRRTNRSCTARRSAKPSPRCHDLQCHAHERWMACEQMFACSPSQSPAGSSLGRGKSCATSARSAGSRVPRL